MQKGRISTTIQGLSEKLQGSTNIATDYAALDEKVKGTQLIKGATLTQTSISNAVGSSYDLRMADGTHLSLKKTGAGEYVVMADRFAVYATIDGNPVGHDPVKDKASAITSTDTQITVDSMLVKEQLSIGTMAFIGGKNVDTIQKDTDGTTILNNSTKFHLISNGGDPNGSNYGLNSSQDGQGVLRFTVYSDNNTALTSAGQTYTNTQDGHTVSSLTGYSIDNSGKLVATYDNGETAVKGQLILAYFNNPEGLMPNGNNTFAATDKSGEPLLSFPGDGLMGQVRSKSLEQSNVDLTNELVKLMVLQRQYSAMSQATKVMAATIIDDTINIGR